MGKHSRVTSLVGIVAKYKKAVIGAAGVVLSALVAAFLGDGSLSFPELVNVVVMGIGAVSVGIAADTPGAKYVKNALAGLAAVAVVLLSVYTDGISSTEWEQMAIAGATAAGVITVRNKGDNLDKEMNANVPQVPGTYVSGQNI